MGIGVLDHLTSDAASHIGSRIENQDGWARWRRRGIGATLAVADGLGGHSGGKQAAGVALHAVIEAFRSPPDDPELAATAALTAASTAVAEARLAAGNDMATTLVVLVLMGGRAGWAWCGDSRLYRYRDGEIERLTDDHSAAMIRLPPEERALADVRGDPARNRLISVLGGQDPMFGQCSDEWHEGDRFVLCSDGFWEGTNRSELAAALAAGKSAQALLDLVLAKRRDSQDNLTVLVAGCDWPHSSD